MTAIDTRPILKHALHRDAAEALREQILDGRLSPGARLIEAEYCAAFGISRTPLREAIKVLESEGLLTVRSGRGVHVTAMTERDIADLFEVIAELERLAVGLAVERMDIGDRARLRRMHDRMIALYRNDELRPCFQADYEIHNFLVARSGNPILADTHARLMVRARRGRYVALFSRARWDEAMSEHQAIMDAIERRDPGCADLMHAHVARTGAVLRRTIAAGAAQTAP